MSDYRKLTAYMYAAGYLGISILTQTIVKWYQYFYTPPETNQGGLKVLIPLGLIGLTMIIARVFDSLADPVVAYFSDKCRSKRGRRIPFILYGAVPLVLTFILVWFPPVQDQSILNFLYLSVLLSLFFIFFTIVVSPYLALIAEITKTEKERIHLTTLQGIAQLLGAMIAEVGSGLLINAANYRVMGIVLGLVSLATIMLTPIFVKEDTSLSRANHSSGLISSILKTFRNRNFLYYLIPYMAVWFGINTMTITMPYMSEILLCMPPEYSGYLIAGAFVCAAIFSPFLPFITSRYGKKKVIFVSFIMFGVLLLFMGLFGTVLSGIVAYGIVFLAGVPLAVSLIVPNAMVADIAELDGLENGEKREAMFFGAQGLANKIVLGLSSLLTPLLFNVFGYSTTRPLGLQLCGPVAGITVILCTVFLTSRYSLTERYLEDRRGDSIIQHENEISGE